MNKLKDNYKIRLRCATCGCEDQFEFNDDKSYIESISPYARHTIGDNQILYFFSIHI